jgi:DNA polymerase I-like protein with 3'-5' exonuclease and polymerase domains
MADEAFSRSVLDADKDVHTETQKRCSLPSRHIAKTFFYGLIFGSGDAKAGRIVGGTAEDGKRLKQQVFVSIPALKECIDKLTNDWRKSARKWYNKRYRRMEYKDGYIRGLDGRPIQVDSEHKVLVYTLQSDEAIQMQVAYCVFHKWLLREGWEWGRDFAIVLWMHDEWQVECKPALAPRVAELGNEAIAWAGRYLHIPIKHEGNSKIGRHWGETH